MNAIDTRLALLPTCGSYVPSAVTKNVFPNTSALLTTVRLLGSKFCDAYAQGTRHPKWKSRDPASCIIPIAECQTNAHAGTGMASAGARHRLSEVRTLRLHTSFRKLPSRPGALQPFHRSGPFDHTTCEGGDETRWLIAKQVSKVPISLHTATFAIVNANVQRL